MAAPIDAASLRVQDPADIAAAMRLEYQLLRQQISDADNTCVLILGLLITASLTITGFATQRLAASVAWLLMPLWLFGYWYLTEKRFIILKTALYLRTQVEVKYPGLGWESWNQSTRHVLGEAKTPIVRYRPFHIESGITGVVAITVPVFVAYTASWNLGEPWFWIALLSAVVLLVTMLRNLRAYRSVPRE